MKAIATNGSYVYSSVHVSPQLHLKVEFLRPIEPRDALFALRQGNVQLVYDEKYCYFNLIAFNHTDAKEISTLEAQVNLREAHLHHGQFCPGQSFDLLMDGDRVAVGTIVEVKHPDLAFWDWAQPPVTISEPAFRFNADQIDCFLMNLEFDILDLPFTKDYCIYKLKAGEYALEIRLFSSVEALHQSQAQQIIDLLSNLPYQYTQLKPNFYQLDPGEELENFECSFIIGDGIQYLTGHFRVV
jgi:hypothetical protein